MNRLARWSIMGRKDYNEALITVVKLSGVLQAFTGPARAPQARRLLNIDRVEKWFNRAFTKSLRPAACAITINSPGGSPVQADLIYTLIRRLSKSSGIPVFTFAEDVAASGGYWLMCAGDKSYALNTSLVGSIGVISATFGATEAAAKLGIERRVYTAGEAKVQLDPFLPVTPEAEARLRDLMEDLHESFRERVRGSRGERLAAGLDAELYSGRAWTGRQALKLGLVDGLGDMRSVMLDQFGAKARFLLCSEAPQPSVRDLFGLGSLLPSGSSARQLEAGGGGGDGGGVAQRLLGRLAGGAGGVGGISEEAYYAAARSTMEAAMDEAQQRALWDRFRLH
ncbi:multidrug transporter [Micractinium conductrix]|uniref:Multidrug transporter n=1 Tax=Micractinium conductrix TaxID=554055 RepID=A0A2P6VEI4_9CHLO|nr:multidrug transporter [Micractinium conductrix]|eukprot:PSC72510.1 multidrug transporter [Micractinium conductrix]